MSNLTPKIILVTGPARSGKSEWAESLAMQSQKSVVYVATAQLNADDREWQARIEQHRQRRPNSWKTLQVSIDLAEAIRESTAADCLLIDSLGTWLANLLDQDAEVWQKTLDTLLQSLKQAKSEIILVAEEAGWGVVPAYPIGRLFRDRLGMVVRQVGAIAYPVYLVTGGHVLNLSKLGTPFSNPSSNL
jgi:adenosylcobinamide kinase/adenosylcobinamide-phosphate guanylyltransferase